MSPVFKELVKEEKPLMDEWETGLGNQEEKQRRWMSQKPEDKESQGKENDRNVKRQRKQGRQDWENYWIQQLGVHQ